MNTTQQQTPSNETPAEERQRGCGVGRCGRRGGALFVLVAALVAGAAGGYVGKSFAFGPFGGHMGGRTMGMSGPIDPAKIDTQIERMIKHFAVEVEVDQVQRDKLTVIAKGAAKDLLPLRDKLQSARQQAIAIAGAPNVDRAGMEKFRGEQIALADTVSRRMTQALADAAEVLTPAQRQKIAAHMKERSEHRPFWRRG